MHGLSDGEVRDEAITLLLAGHETTAQAPTWTFALLAEHPDAEARLHREVDTVLAGRAPEHDDARRAAVHGRGGAREPAAVPAGVGDRRRPTRTTTSAGTA